MHVIILTVFLSLVLVVFFLTLFVGQRSRGGSISSAERDSLLPFSGDEQQAPDGAEKPEK